MQRNHILILLLALLGMGLHPVGQADETTKRPATKSGAQLWREHCGTCHNLRNPGDYSDAQWEVAVQHMRIRANLTAEEARAIAAFLKMAN